MTLLLSKINDDSDLDAEAAILYGKVSNTMTIFLISLGVGSRQYCRYTPIGYYPLKVSLGVPTCQRKFDLGGV